jgi:hypothetical protein
MNLLFGSSIVRAAVISWNIGSWGLLELSLVSFAGCPIQAAFGLSGGRLRSQQLNLPSLPLRGFPQIPLQLRLREEIRRQGKCLAQTGARSIVTAVRPFRMREMVARATPICSANSVAE